MHTPYSECVLLVEGGREGGREDGMEGGMDGWMDGWMEGWMDGWREGGRDGWREDGMEGGMGWDGSRERGREIVVVSLSLSSLKHMIMHYVMELGRKGGRGISLD